MNKSMLTIARTECSQERMRRLIAHSTSQRFPAAEVTIHPWKSRNGWNSDQTVARLNRRLAPLKITSLTMMSPRMLPEKPPILLANVLFLDKSNTSPFPTTCTSRQPAGLGQAADLGPLSQPADPGSSRVLVRKYRPIHQVTCMIAPGLGAPIGRAARSCRGSDTFIAQNNGCEAERDGRPRNS
jgi:hypothetical protein